MGAHRAVELVGCGVGGALLGRGVGVWGEDGGLLTEGTDEVAVVVGEEREDAEGDEDDVAFSWCVSTSN